MSAVDFRRLLPEVAGAAEEEVVVAERRRTILLSLLSRLAPQPPRSRCRGTGTDMDTASADTEGRVETARALDTVGRADMVDMAVLA